MSIRYTAMAMTGLNNPSRVLKCADERPSLRDSFADAKAEVVARAEIVRQYLDSSGCDYQMHSASGAHQYEVSFEYGPRSFDTGLTFTTVLHVYKCTVEHGRIHEIEP